MELHDFQKRAIQKFFSTQRLLVAHPTGAGKTLTALEIVKHFKNKVLIITPANLRDNIIETNNKFKLNLDLKIILKKNEIDLDKICIISYDFLRNNISIILQYYFDLIVADEIHHCKNRNSLNYKLAMKISNKCKYFLGLSGSPFQNNIDEFWNIINIIIGEEKNTIFSSLVLYKWDYRNANVFKKIMNMFFFKNPILGPVKDIRDKEKFYKILSPYIDLVNEEEINQITDRPNFKIKIINVDMTKEEWNNYNIALQKVDKILLNRIKNGKIGEFELIKILNKLSAARQVLLAPDYIFSKSEYSSVSKKIKTVVEEIENSDNQCIVFTNFVEFGAKLLFDYMLKKNISCQLYTGETKKNNRKKILDEFKNNKLKCLIVSQVGSEGLDIPEAKKIIILEPHFNPEVIKQRYGRALRINSNFNLVDIYFYFSKGPNNEDTVDHYIYNIAQEKENMNNMIKNILRGKFNDN